ncbi:MAG: accessory factor UbiK family protein [Maricaulis sp.]|jgi:BMFP domain-containing protein YqiC|nr:accessory factor UbiK family protein [Maricaulis sp.]MDG2044262.1 accessory factor UbiK family protein [Maricaulis sp.]
MQTRNPLLNDFAELMTDAFGAAQAAGDEARSVFRAQADRVIVDMDLVSREEYDAVKAALAAGQEEIEDLKKRLDALEARVAKPASRATKPRKKATTAKKTPKSTS